MTMPTLFSNKDTFGLIRKIRSHSGTDGSISKAQKPIYPIKSMPEKTPENCSEIAVSVSESSSWSTPDEYPDAAQLTYEVGVADDQNKRYRRTMEDRHVIVRDFAGNDNPYFGLFDGHAGVETAAWCQKSLHILLHDNLTSAPSAPPRTIIENTCLEADKIVSCNNPISGTTAIIALLRWESRDQQTCRPSLYDDPNLNSNNTCPTEKVRTLVVANVGDARCVLSRQRKSHRLTYDHKPCDTAEYRRIVNSGGKVTDGRVSGLLGVTRAIGDAQLGSLVPALPFVSDICLTEQDEFLILACDGLWDVMCDQYAVDYVHKSLQKFHASPKKAAQSLVKHALSLGSTDNISVMIVKFKHASKTK
ncbi:hypothetical protein CANCADRAFT_89983 [Tortispora caseinolytica NRRL Y-17796]|uniref:PPM-type phosphatase domain-containing protein n=1 Tax=Tortispora caseinolytica NRRL Y-17796 TaxID=767744 RepID=A0A1E4TLK9_9ASCO|nr:hypothetical protein CANCADRAFT_89983 [Tortispora caseinolytica NRRL Y-17796]